jgi:hypothetical protein
MPRVKRQIDDVHTARKCARGYKPRAAVGGLALVYGFLMATAAMTAFAPDANALRVTMKRVLFEGSKRADIIVLINNTNEEAVYRLGWRRMRMTETQSIVAVEEGEATPDIKPADDFVKYAPRRVVLPPGGSQQVRLMLRKPQDLPDGEYRSHFWIEPEASAVKFEPKGDNVDATKGPAVQIKMLTGVTMPVIVRTGNLTVTGGIVDGFVTRGAEKSKAQFTLTREGTRSLYGDLEFTCGATVVHKVNGLAVYTEVGKRILDFDINGLPADCGTVKVVYKAAEDDAQYRGGVIAEASLPVR